MIVRAKERDHGNGFNFRTLPALGMQAREEAGCLSEIGKPFELLKKFTGLLDSDNCDTNGAATVMLLYVNCPPIPLSSHRPALRSHRQHSSGPLFAGWNWEAVYSAPDTSGVISRGVTRNVPGHRRVRGNGRRGRAAWLCEDRSSCGCDMCGNESDSCVEAVKVRRGHVIWRGECHLIRRLGKRGLFPIGISFAREARISSVA